MKYAQDVTELIGNTPLVQVGSASVNDTLVLAKCEYMNPLGSVKDRVGLALVLDAIDRGEIDSDSTLIEATSGNTGIALAGVCAAKGLRLVLTMPESMSKERRDLLSGLGAELILTPASLGMTGSVEEAERLASTIDGGFLTRQFANSANPDMHKKTTAVEIIHDCDNIDIFVAAVGTGGTITGVGSVLKEHFKDIKIVAVEPENSAVLSGDSAGPHTIQGIGAGFVPEILDTSVYSEIIKVNQDDAITTAKRVAKEEGLLVGISSGANIYAATLLAQRAENRGKTIVTILPDTGERYLSVGLYS